MKKITVIAVLFLLMIGHAYSQTKQKKEVMNNKEKKNITPFSLAIKLPLRQ
jgi:hypothetical protein